MQKNMGRPCRKTIKINNRKMPSRCVHKHIFFFKTPSRKRQKIAQNTSLAKSRNRTWITGSSRLEDTVQKLQLWIYIIKHLSSWAEESADRRRGATTSSEYQGTIKQGTDPVKCSGLLSVLFFSPSIHVHIRSFICSKFHVFVIKKT